MSVSRSTVIVATGLVLPLLATFLTLPTYVGLIGDTRFGALALLWSIQTYAALFDLGMGQAVAQGLAAGDGDESSNSATKLNAAHLIALAMGCVGALFAMLIAYAIFSYWVRFDDPIRRELLDALPWLVILIPVTTSTNVLVGALQAAQAFSRLTCIVAATSVLAVVLTLGVAAAGEKHIASLVAVTLFCRMLGLLLLLQAARRRYATTSLAFSVIEAKKLLHYGKWVTISAIVGPLMVSVDRFVIGALLGARAVSHYVIPFQLAERIPTLSAAMNYALLPRIAASNSEAERLALGRRSVRLASAYVLPAVVVCILFADTFLKWWISEEFSRHATAPAQVLVFGYWLNSVALSPHTKLMATGRVRAIAVCHIAELTPYLVVLVALVASFGITGAAMAFTVRVAVDLALLAHLAGMLRNTLFALSVPVLLLSLAMISVHNLNDDGMRLHAAGLIVVTSLIWSAIQYARKREAIA